MKQMVLVLALAFAMPAFAEDSKMAKKGGGEMMMGQMPEPTKEAREKMAQWHEKHAACLRSDKSMKACHEEMKTNCEAMGEDCPMRKMGAGPGMGHGMGHGQQGKPAGKSK